MQALHYLTTLPLIHYKLESHQDISGGSKQPSPTRVCLQCLRQSPANSQGPDLILFSQLFKKDFIYLFLERGREGEREGEKHQCVVTSHMPPTGDLACNPGMCPDWESNGQPFGSQAGTQSTEPHQPGQET